MQCPKCSSSNDSDAVFCTECGTAAMEGPKRATARWWRSYLYVLLLIPVIAFAAALGYYKFFLPRGTAAVVNGEEIKMSELDAGVARFKAAYGPMNSEGDQGDQQMRRLRYQVLNRMITED